MKERRDSNVTFVTTAVLKNLKWTDHIVSDYDGKQSFKCDICNHSCSQKYEMNTYVVSGHERNKAFKCEICDYRFSQKNGN